MKFWEGAIIVVGGIWLIGRLSRSSASHPVNLAASGAGAAASPSPLLPGGATVETNTDGSNSLVAGETLLPAPPLVGTGITRGTISTQPVNQPVMSTPDPGCATCGGNNSVPMFPTLTPRPQASPLNNKLAGGGTSPNKRMYLTAL